ncbi:hypothetical protein ACQEVF_58250 [Nonomuraea polychroma]|uniref:hypothetical protein n=1 Tax=Nonomuraea polychroma TaxID=46176 RepID=UPI003D91E627
MTATAFTTEDHPIVKLPHLINPTQPIHMQDWWRYPSTAAAQHGIAHLRVYAADNDSYIALIRWAGRGATPANSGTALWKALADQFSSRLIVIEHDDVDQQRTGHGPADGQPHYGTFDALTVEDGVDHWQRVWPTSPRHPDYERHNTWMEHTGWLPAGAATLAASSAHGANAADQPRPIINYGATWTGAHVAVTLPGDPLTIPEAESLYADLTNAFRAAGCVDSGARAADQQPSTMTFRVAWTGTHVEVEVPGTLLTIPEAKSLYADLADTLRAAGCVDIGPYTTEELARRLGVDLNAAANEQGMQ